MLNRLIETASDAVMRAGMWFNAASLPKKIFVGLAGLILIRVLAAALGYG